MRKNYLLIAMLGLSATTVFAQNTYPWPSSDNVGIGTSNPTQKLTVGGNINKANSWIIGDSAWGSNCLEVHNSSWDGISNNNYGNIAGGHGYFYSGLQSGGPSGGEALSGELYVANKSMLIGNVGIGTTSPNYKLDVNGEVSVGGAFRIGELYFSSLQTISLEIGAERWVKLATIPNNHHVRFQIRSGSQNSEEIAEVKVFGTYHNDRTGITVERQTYNEHLREVRVVGSDGGPRIVYIKIRASDYAPSIVWRVIDSKGAITVHNIEETPAAGLSHLVVGNLVTSTNTNVVISGNVGIGTTSPTEKLAVNGKIRAKEVIVDTGWSDYVFAKDYKLVSLSEVEQHITQKGHLPGVPSAAQVAEKGVSVGDMQAVLLAKIEELTLHQIAQEKRLSEATAMLQTQATKIAALEAEKTRCPQ